MKKTVIIIGICIFATLISFCLLSGKSVEYYTKSVVFAQEETLEEKIDKASRLTPTPQQRDWQQLELIAFLHFGINTFTNREWGDGKENPILFNPAEFDADQWISILSRSGFKMAILTAKHHDGFCLWPTKTTKHSVKYSSWQNGKGDVVKAVKDACDKYGLKFGIYLSPWDRNADCYGDSPRYNQFFIDQLTELLSNYGTIHEVWLDGANGEGPNGRKQIYDWQAYYSVIHKLQPGAVTAIKGDDVRWIGNEKGYGRETEWSATVLTPSAYFRAEEQNKKLGINAQSEDLGSRDLLEKAGELFWYPSEVDVSIRPGWFYHPEEDDRVKPLSELMDIYYQSVGCNSVLLLNIPPDNKGLINKRDEERLYEFHRFIRSVFGANYMENSTDLWTAENGESRTFHLKKNVSINTILLQEDISFGQRVEKFYCEGFINGQWEKIAQGTTIGNKRLLLFEDCQTSEIRITIESTRNKAHIINTGAYYKPHIEPTNIERSTYN